MYIVWRLSEGPELYKGSNIVDLSQELPSALLDGLKFDLQMKFIIWLEICYEALQVVLEALGLELLEEDDAESGPVKRARDKA